MTAMSDASTKNAGAKRTKCGEIAVSYSMKTGFRPRMKSSTKMATRILT